MKTVGKITGMKRELKELATGTGNWIDSIRDLSLLRSELYCKGQEDKKKTTKAAPPQKKRDQKAVTKKVVVVPPSSHTDSLSEQVDFILSNKNKRQKK